MAGAAATPALDRLAAGGVRFDFAHAHAVTTLSSHASILTGTYPFQHGIRDNSGYRLPAGAQTLATLLKQAGYADGRVRRRAFRCTRASASTRGSIATTTISAKRARRPSS